MSRRSARARAARPAARAGAVDRGVGVVDAPSAEVDETVEVDAGFEDDDLDPAASDAALDDGDEGRLPWLVRDARNVAWVLLVCGVIGLAASFSLTLEYLHKLQAPDEALLCDINPFVTCGPAMQSWAGSILGFPNIIIGLVCFAVTITIAMGTFAGARFKPWFWIGFQIGLVGAAALITFLQWFSVMQLAKLCLWCMIIWAGTIPLVTIGTVFNLAQGHLGRGGERVGRAIAPYTWAIVAIWYVAVIGFIFAGMWSTIALTLGV